MQLPAATLAIASRQSGAITRAQACSSGLTPTQLRTLVDSGRWQRALRGVLVIHNGPLSFDTHTWAALLYAGAGAVASHQTGAYLLRLVDEPPQPVDVMVPANRRVRPPAADVRIRYREEELLRRSQVRGIPVTAPTSTVLDLLGGIANADAVVALIATACQRRLATPGAIRAAAVVRPKLRWRALLADVCADVSQGVESPLERHYLLGVERAHGLPPARRQRVMRLAASVYRHDVEYEEYALVIELDGLAYHRGRREASDAARDNALVVAGRLVLRYRWVDVVGSPCAVAEQVAAALTMRGWSGTLRTCRHCS